MHTFLKIVLIWLVAVLSDAQADDLVLEFPQNPVGVVTYSQQPHTEFLLELVAQTAKGKVSVPIDAYIGLELAGKQAADLSFLEKLPSDTIESLRISNTSLGEELLASIAQLNSLKKLDFYGCTFSESTFGAIGESMQPLEAFSISGLQPDSDYAESLATWLAKLPNLQSLYCSPQLDASALKLLAGHSSLRSLNIRLGDDSDEVLEAVAQLPKLEELVMWQEEEIDAQVAEKFSLLDSVKSIRWFYGKIDRAILQALAKLKELEELELLAELAFDAPEELAKLQSLKKLEIRLLDQREDGPLLPGFTPELFDLPELVEWPTLEYVTPDLLSQISQCERIEKLTIKSVTGDVTQADIEQLCNLRNLRGLHLEWVPLDDQGVEKLAQLSKLQELTLWGTDATGAGFAALSSLPDLRTVTFYHANSAGEPDFAPLAQLPELVDLTIGGNFILPRHVEPLKNCRKLRKIYTIAGVHVDDSVIEWLSQLDNLDTLLLGDGCLITDRGVQSLDNLASLKKLWVRGLITAEGVEILAAMPSMMKLQVRSLNVSDAETAALKDKFDYLSIYFRPFDGVTCARDGFLRSGERDALDELEDQPAPPLAGTTYPGGEELALQDLHGKVVLIDFWGTWCGPCRTMEPELERLFAKYHDEGLEILGVHTKKDADQLQEYMDERQLPWSSLLDSSGEFVDSYQVRGYPSFYVVDQQGDLRVAGAHFYGLETIIKALLSPPQTSP